MKPLIPYWVKKLIDEPGVEQVEKAVAEAEKKTAAEIIPLVVSKSSVPYPEFMYGYIFCALAAFFTVNPLFLLVSYGLYRLNKKIQKDYCRARAVEEFSKLGLANTAGKTGVLLMVSVKEQQVVVLADQGIHDFIPGDKLSEIVKELMPKIRTASLGEGMSFAVNQLGEMCAPIVPRQHQDKNELHDRLVIKE
jgi:uncharacterized membrane protein